MSIINFKRDLVLFKMRMGLPHTITKTDIVPLCNRSFANYFARVPSNRHSIADRGWNPLNRSLLFNTEVLKKNIVEIVDKDTVTAAPRNIFTGDQLVISSISSTSSVASTSTATCRSVTQTLNLTSGSVGTIITDMIHYALKEEGVNDNLKKCYALEWACHIQSQRLTLSLSAIKRSPIIPRRFLLTYMLLLTAAGIL